MTGDSRHTVYTVLSRGSVRIPAQDLLIDGTLSVDSAVQERGYFTVHFRGADLELTAGGFCGFVPLNSRCAVEIRPKMPVQNFNRIFDVAALRFQSIAERTRPYNLDIGSTAPFSEFLAAELVGALRALVGLGLRKRYVLQGRSDDKPRGKIDFGRTVRDNLAQGKGHRVYTRSYELLVDISENRIIRAAGELIVRKLRAHRVPNRELIAELGALLSYFTGVGQATPTELQSLVESETPAPSTDLSTYPFALNIARLILNGLTARLDYLGSEIDLTAVVVDFEKLFEAYLRNVLRLDHRKLGSLRVLDGNREGKKPLFDARSKPMAEPDIVIRTPDGEAALLVEVKYKSSPDRADINQAVTYAISYRVSRIIIAHQAVDEANEGLKTIGKIGSTQIYGYGIFLDSVHLEGKEAAFIDAVIDLAHGKNGVVDLPPGLTTAGSPVP